MVSKCILEKSRQAAIIDKAISDESSNMLWSLVPIGEYDDVKQLVCEGSPRLRKTAAIICSQKVAIPEIHESSTDAEITVEEPN